MFNWPEVLANYQDMVARPLEAATVPAFLQAWSNLAAQVQEALAVAQRAIAENTQDQAAQSQSQFVNLTILPASQQLDEQLSQKLLLITDHTVPAELEGFWREMRSRSHLFRAENVGLLAAINEQVKQYDVLMSQPVLFDGRPQPRPTVNRLLQETDRDLREVAWRALAQARLHDRERLNQLFLQLLHQRQQVAHNAGFANYRDYAWQERLRFDYTPAEALAFHEHVAEYVVPLLSQWDAERMTALAVDRLRPWDKAVDPENRQPLRPFADIEQLVSTSQQIFARLDGDLAAQFGQMQAGWLDLAARAGKRPGGFCMTFAASQRPYIFMNAAGGHGDVITLLHEAGHAFHAFATFSHPLVFTRRTTAEFNEVASMAMELLTLPYLAAEHGGFYSRVDASRAKAEQLRRTLELLPHLSTMDCFQHWLYTQDPATLTAEALDAAWAGFARRFQPTLDWSGLDDELYSNWHNVLHIFKLPFYMIDYQLAQLGALQIYRNALANHAEALAQYKHALTLGNTKPLPALYQAAGAVFPIKREVVGEVVEFVAQQLLKDQ
jgi:oligoendopeptidase F